MCFTRVKSAKVWHIIMSSSATHISNEPHPAFTPQLHPIIALWPTLIGHPAEDRRLSWPRWLVLYQGRLPA